MSREPAGTASASVFVPRAQRRHARVWCRVFAGDNEWTGRTTNISATGVGLRLECPELESGIPAVGDSAHLTLRLPELTEALAVAVEIVWVAPVRTGGARAQHVELGARIVSASGEATERLASFVTHFRYPVLAVGVGATDLVPLGAALESECRVRLCASVQEAWRVFAEEEFAAVLLGEGLPWADVRAFACDLSARFPLRRTWILVLSTQDRTQRLADLSEVPRLFSVLPVPIGAAELRHVLSVATETYTTVLEMDFLHGALERANRKLLKENAFLRQRMIGRRDFEEFVGNSPTVQDVLRVLDRIRITEAPVHIRGDTGTGKELVARALHRQSKRARGPFVAQNCAGFTESLQLSTLFGYRKGAFTGADRDQPGVFQEACGGTLFLDEIAELALPVQANLLRALEGGEVVPVGATKPEKVDVRFISATHRDLSEEVKAGRFREDLFYRLVVMTVSLPSLRERHGDIPLLAQHFLELCCQRYGKDIPGFSIELMQLLERHAWPGNIRELRNEIERMVVLAEPGQKLPAELASAPLRIPAPTTSGVVATDQGLLVPYGPPFDELVASVQRALISWALRESQGVVARAAELLRVDRTRLTKMRKRQGLDAQTPDAE